MYDTSLTHQALPTSRYLYLLGVAVSVFASNNGFIIENILRTEKTYEWDKLVDLESGRLLPYISATISSKAGKDIEELFERIVELRNRIVHGFRITSECGEQILATKERGKNNRFDIDEDYLLEFIRLNDELSQKLIAFRGF